MKRMAILLCLFATFAVAQDFSGIKIYVNPGHGGNDPANDRYIPETGFWESEGNLTKGLYIRDLLQMRGAQVIMSRVTNFERDDRTLSAIAAEANANQVDFFHSIHSNATGTATKANYTLMLFRGYDTQPVFPAARSLSQIMVAELTAANRTVPSTNTVRGDWSFYTSWGDKVGLGILRTLIMPGVLSEGSFHDYIPESFRLTNLAYRKHEAVSFLRSWIRYFNTSPLPYSTVAGIVRDPTKNVAYTWLSAQPADAKMPVNNISVRLEPGGRTCQGDANHNGFFFFDSVAIGDYTLHVSAPGYAPDSALVSVKASQANFCDFYAINTAPPHIASYTPADPGDSVRISTAVTIRFTNTMSTAKTEGAFHITPPVEGVFTWQDYDQVMSFTASRHFDPKTTYRVTIDSNAVNKLDAPIDSTFSFEFTTDAIGRFELESSYPNAEQNSALSTTLQVRLLFNQPIATASVSGNLYVEDAAGTRVTLIRAKVIQEGGKGRIQFELKNTLANASTYKIVVSEWVRSSYNIRLSERLEIFFTTAALMQALDHIIDPCDVLTHWQAPALHPASDGIDVAATKITAVTDRIVSNNNAIRMNYAFSGDSGRVALFREQPLALTEITPASNLGIWVFGDLSHNELALCFSSPADSLIVIAMDTVDYSGWKLHYVDAQQIAAETDHFLGVMILKTAAGLRAGELGFDDLSSGQLTGVTNRLEPVQPAIFSLQQNYPNPFNPATTIRFNLAREEKITLSVYNLCGEKIRTLIGNENHNPGEHAAVWDGRRDDGRLAPSGVYFYRLVSASQKQSKKMTLIK